MAKRKFSIASSRKGSGSERGGGINPTSSVRIQRGPRARSQRGTVIPDGQEVVLDTPSEEKPPSVRRPKGKGLAPGPLREVAKSRMDSKFGNGNEPPRSSSAPHMLPFENTLAYVFRVAGGKETAVNAARLVMDSDERFQRMVFAYDTASTTDKANLTLEDLCSAGDITPDEFLEKVIPALWRRSADIGKLMAAISHPKVIEATVHAAMGPFGTPDRKMLLESSGFLPTSKGVTFINNPQTLNVGSRVEGEKTIGLPSFEEDAILTTQALRGDESSKSAAKPKLIAATTTVITAEIVEKEKVPIVQS